MAVLLFGILSSWRRPTQIPILQNQHPVIPPPAGRRRVELDGEGIARVRIVSDSVPGIVPDRL